MLSQTTPEPLPSDHTTSQTTHKAEVAAELGITQESVSILERKALNHLREALRRGTFVGPPLTTSDHL